MIVHIRQRLYLHPGSDTAVMRRLTWVPGEIWALALLAGTVVALAYGGRLLTLG